MSSMTSLFTVKMMTLYLVLLGLNFSFTTCQTPLAGSKCPLKVPKHSIDMRKLTGQWYEIEASPLMAEWMFTCISIKVSSFFEEKSQIKIEAIQQGFQYAEPKTIAVLEASTSHTSSGTDGRVTVNLVPGINKTVTHFEVNLYIKDLYVLDTDYKNWALIWSCRSYQKTDARSELVWILSRQRTLNAEYYRAVRSAVSAFNLEGIKTEDTIQAGCTGDDDADGKEDD